MAEIIPAIMPKSAGDLAEKLALLGNFSGVVQLDLMDGVFVPEETWMPDKLPEGKWELDLMIKNALARINEWLALKPKRLIFHLEAEDERNFNSMIGANHLMEMEIGAAMNTITPIEKILPLISQIDFIQCMGIEKIGYQGQPFDEKVFTQIARLREKFPALPLSVDGGVNLENARRLVAAGAARLVVGSVIWNSPDPAATLKKFQELL